MKKRLTNNQKEYIRLIRNAVRFIKKANSKNDTFGSYIMPDEKTLPVPTEAYTKGYRLTVEEILNRAPKIITKKTLSGLTNRKVKSKLDYVSYVDTDNYGKGEIITGIQRDFLKFEYKKKIKKEYKEYQDYKKERMKEEKELPSTQNFNKSYKEYDNDSNVTAQRLVMDHFLSEFNNHDTLGTMVRYAIKQLEEKVGVYELGNALKVIDNHYFWSIMERHPHASKDGINEFMQRVIEELPDSVFDEETKDALRMMADGNETP